MKEILTNIESGVLTISLNRLEKKNSLTAEIFRHLTGLLTDAKSDGAIRVVVIRGTEQVFSAGNDLGEFVPTSSVNETLPGFDFLNALHAFPKPLIAGVCGAAIGIGATMLLHFDLVFAGDNARFSMPFVNLGLSPEAASSMLLPRLAGYQRAAEILLTGTPFDADKALAIGLVNKIFPASMLLSHVETLARDLAKKSSTSLAETKRLMKMGDSADIERRMSDEFEVFRKLLKGGAVQEAIVAFHEKRVPDLSKF
ncbi:enoyl-CoA hydratase/isomerase family protein [Pseudomonas fluorescens]|uniref:Enoyl-CoA hydratase/isomerase family protein n=1 Tax=Pseudomonas fluorescens TaxID=294 RepID=A0A0P8Z9B6_PSEFL|nr:enoyl-CoA hydratase [Pseudomonas fluorescens]KPU62123.1 enoyl-CoA hydratase/isomerase family protein [Pseudomonas fluorescens]